MNLLSTFHRETVRKEHLWRLLEVSGFVIIILLILSFVLLVPSALFINFEISSAETALQNVKAERALLEKDTETQSLVKEIRAQLDLVRTEKPEMLEVFPTVEKFLLRRTPGITVKSLTFNRNAAPEGPRGSLELSGVAVTRQSLLAFVSSLETEPLFSHVESPITNLVKERDIKYTIHVDLK